MEYLNIGSVFVGVLLILGFFNADAIFREPAISDGFDDAEDNPHASSSSSQSESSRMYTREMLAELAYEFGLPVVELERRIDSGVTLHEIAAASGRSREMESILNEYSVPAQFLS